MDGYIYMCIYTYTIIYIYICIGTRPSLQSPPTALHTSMSTSVSSQASSTFKHDIDDTSIGPTVG